MPEPIVQQRIVPGAPPPAPLSKTQKKKRKAKSKPDQQEEHVQDTNTEPADSLAPEPIAREQSQAPSIAEDDLFKHSPIVELVAKRLRSTNKKISRYTAYAATDPEKLNYDQLRTLKTLPTLEAIQKELGEVKKAIEVHEADLVNELAAKRAEAEKAEKARIAEAISAAQSSILTKTPDLLNLIRFRSSLANGEIDTSALSLVGAEATAIYSAADALLSEDGDRKQAAISGFLLGEGDLDGVSYQRIVEITNLALNPPREPTPEPVELEEPSTAPSTISQTGPSEPDHVVSVAPVSVTASNSFRFMQESEIEGPSEDVSPEAPQEEAITQDDVEPTNGHAEEEEEPAPAPTAVVAPIDWSAEETAEELPSIAGLQAEFGTSGTNTPAEQTPETTEAPVNGESEDSSVPPITQEDGFQPNRDHHHHPYRGRGRGGFRGGDRGFGGRGRGRGGGDGSGFRGYRGRGGYRGGYRGEGGENINGERVGRGGFRSGRDHHHSHGENRGEGEGGENDNNERAGRGGFRGGRDHHHNHGENRGEGEGGENGNSERVGRGGFRGGRDHHHSRGENRGEGEGGENGNGNGERRGGYRGEGENGERGGRGGHRGGYRGEGGPREPREPREHRGDGERRGGGRGGRGRGGPRSGTPSTPAPTPTPASVPIV